MQLDEDQQTDKQTEYLQYLHQQTYIPAVKQQNNGLNSTNLSQLSSFRMNSTLNHQNKQSSRKETKENIKSYFRFHGKKVNTGTNKTFSTNMINNNVRLLANALEFEARSKNNYDKLTMKQKLFTLGEVENSVSDSEKNKEQSQ